MFEDVVFIDHGCLFKMACAQTHVAAWEEQKRLSCFLEEDLAEFKAKEDYFTCNWDEACLLSCDGNVKVLGGAGKRKQGGG